MGTQIKITADNLSNIAAKLDAAGANLSVEERGLLASVFQAAAVQIHGDVQGFASIAAVSGTPLGTAFGGIFTAPGGAAAVAGVAGTATASAATTGTTTGAGVSIPAVGGASSYVVL